MTCEEQIKEGAKGLARLCIIRNSKRAGKTYTEEFMKTAIAVSYEDYMEEAAAVLEAIKNPINIKS